MSNIKLTYQDDMVYISAKDTVGLNGGALSIDCKGHDKHEAIEDAVSKLEHIEKAAIKLKDKIREL